MHRATRLGLVLIALFTSAHVGRSADGTELPTTGLVPKVVETESLAENDHDFDTQAQVLTVDLRPYFTVAGLREADGNLVQFKTSLGTFNAELLASDTPLSVANFKSYVATDAMSAAAKAKTYDQTFVHRSANISNNSTPHVIIQGGGFRVDNNLSALAAKPSVANEFKFANTRGTLAMAKLGGQPNSATNEWFVNINDNKSVLGSDNNGGFTVFGRLLGNGIQVAEAISKLPTYNLGQAFTNLPLRNVKPGQTTLYFENLVSVTSVRIVPLQPPATGKGASVLNYTVTSDNPSAVTTSIANGKLTVKPGKLGGRAILTVRASEGAGAFAESSFAINRDGPPIIVKQLPATTTAALGTSVKLTADITAWPLNIQWQSRPTKNDVWTDIPANDARFTGTATEYLTIKLTGTDSTTVGQALALDKHQFRFRLTNDHGGRPRVAEGSPTTLRITTTLGFHASPTFTVGSANGKLGASLTAPLGGTVVLSRPALAATYPAPTYRWERLAPGATTWEPLVNAVAAQKGSGTNENPEFPAVPSPYSGVTTANLTIRLNGPETPATNSIAISTLATVALHQSQYRCVITHNRGAGDLSAVSPVTTLRITSLPVGVAAQPPKLVYGLLTYDQDQEEADISVTRISVSAKPFSSNTPVKYQWQGRLAGTSEWIPLVNHKPAKPASGDTPATPEVPTPYKGVDTPTLTIRFPSDKNTTPGYGLLLDGAEYRCVLSNVLKNASAPFGPAAGTAIGNTTSLRVLAGTVSLVTQENFRLPGLRAPGEGVTFAIKELPKGAFKGLPKGLTLDPLTGIITGVPLDKPGVYTLVIVATEGTTAIEITYHIELLPLIHNSSGSYEALLSPTDRPPVAKLALTVSANGTLTGTLTTTKEKDALPLRGAVVRDAGTGVVSFSSPVVISRPGDPKGRAYVLTDLVIPTTGKVEAKLHTRDTAASPLVEWASATSILVDDNNPDTNTKIEAGNPGIRLATYSKTNRAPWNSVSNSFTLAISAPAPLDPDSGDERPFPAGSGYATAPISANGNLGFAGKLADGTKFTASLAGGIDASFRLFVRPYSGATDAVLSAELPMSFVYINFFYPRYSVFGDAGKDAYWTKPDNVAKTPNYADGFGPLAVQVRLEPWFPSDYPDFGFVKNSAATHGTADVLLEGVNLGATVMPEQVSLKLNYRDSLITFTNAAASNPSKFTGKLNTHTGFFSGSFDLVDPVPGSNPPKTKTRKVAFEGVLLMSQKLVGGTVTAEGFTLVPAAPGATVATPSSGRIQFLDPRDPPPPEEDDEDEEP